ncbi:MAG: DUF4911 domain-containing protein [Desulfovibrio sp.]|nr:DUF4911 domain-containing protein [Desulfovibrio sp.]MCA1986313.1 DUF4911 domain-containing protein [Desulfovibrio sp.]
MTQPLDLSWEPSPAPRRSGRCYLRLAGRDVAMAKFELEAFGHLGVLSVLDRWECVAVITHAPGMQAMLARYLEALAELVEFEVLYRSPPPAHAATTPPRPAHAARTP